MITNLIIALFLAPLSMMGQEGSFTEGIFRCTIIDEGVVEISSARHDSIIQFLGQDRTLVIPKSIVHEGKYFAVERIGKNAFSLNDEIEKLLIEEGVKSIDKKAFMFCSNLKMISIPASVTSIGGHAFHYCENLRSIVVAKDNPVYDSREDCNAIIEYKTLILGCSTTTIPQSVGSIDEEAFTFCKGMETIAIPEGVETIAPFAFTGCMDLKSVKISSTAYIVSYLPFYFCSQLKEIEVDEESSDYDSRKGYNALICPTGEKELVFGCSNTVIPSYVKVIDDFAFTDCVQLKEIKIPEGVEEIGDFAFWGCINLKKVKLPKTVKRIGYQAFSPCTEVKNIPENVSR